MEEIKSAYEKALERTEKLERLSPEEMREWKEREYAPIGRALAERYLGDGRIQILKEGINKHIGAERDIVAKAALTRLLETIQLQDYEVAEKATAALSALKGGEQDSETREKIRNLCQKYKQAEQQKYAEEKKEIEKRGRELLYQLGISGDAVGEIKLEASEAWKEISASLYSQFDEKLKKLKQAYLK